MSNGYAPWTKYLVCNNVRNLNTLVIRFGSFFWIETSNNRNFNHDGQGEEVEEVVVTLHVNSTRSRDYIGYSRSRHG